ncbi:MAG: SMP-30/gluconolactonase/LRE family protein [Clostridia bacterium]|nr:SMP-30/gluconolactonase/LRE family protein [Clostridia bacterium]MDR3645048.1 SMP-30/gluconolactonase/LRE family protein [Clostridia bacterium]
MEKYDIISSFPYRCGECPMWDVKNQLFLWSDMLAGELFTYDPAANAVKKLAQGRNVSGFTLNKSGGLVCATHQGLYLWDSANGWRLIADEFAGQALHSNDATADPQGRFIFGTTFYDQTVGDNFVRGKLYSVEKDGSITIIDEGLGLANGIAFSPDQKYMYVTDTYLREIYKYDYDVATGKVSNRRTHIRIPDTEGIPDGMTVDAQGYIWSAQWYGSCLVRYNPDGNFDSRLHVPSGQTSSVVFGGADLTDIYVTTAAEVVRLSAAPKGYDFDAPHNGSVYRFNLDIKGMPEFVADITLS